MRNAKISLAMFYQRITILFWASLIVGNIFQKEPPSYLLLVISVLSIFTSKRIINIYYIKQYIFLISFAIYGIIVAFFTKGGVGAPITIITGLIVVYAAQELKLERVDIAILIVAILLSLVYWIYKSPTYYNDFFYNHWKGDGSYTNSNGVGHYLAYECSLIYIIMSTSSKRWVRWLKYFLAILCVYGCINVKARMAVMTLILFLFINVIILCFHKYRIQIVKLCLNGAIALEIIFPFLYLNLYKIGFGKDIKMFGLSEKGLYSGREEIWKNAFNAMTSLKSIIFGIGSKHDFWIGHPLNMHNNAMNLLVVVGSIGVIVYFFYLIIYIYRNFDFYNASNIQWQCLIFFICILIEGTTDITLFYNNFLAYYFIPLGIALNKNYTKTNSKWKS